METTRRTFLGAIGAAAALGIVGEPALSGETSAPLRDSGRAAAASKDKVRFWVAASTPCDKNLNFDPELY
ncbi:MAG TPA: twin-arginine translocation signal domain-containing protein, partial [Candidatus Acidoferrum sp.]|nr:twin-arginine translocation signal domain-containing protein [Candidatus Acidoferrum sp.]